MLTFCPAVALFWHNTRPAQTKVVKDRQWGKKEWEAGNEVEKAVKGPKPGKNNPSKS